MQNVSPQFVQLLRSNQDDIVPVDVFEFYPPDETDLFPENAERRFAATELIWFGWKYERQAIDRGNIRKFVDGKSNTVTITLSNVDRSVSTWLADKSLEGYRVRVRAVSRSIDDDSITLGVFRCEKATEINNNQVQITAKQYFGSIQNTLPPNEFQQKCPLEFKGLECLGGQLLSEKSATYQAALTCNKSRGQCRAYSNEPAFQGEWFNGITGNFKVNRSRGGAGGAVLSLIGLGNKRVTSQYTSQSDSPYGKAVIFGLGRTSVEFMSLQHADTGEYLAGQWCAGDGPATALLNVHNVSGGWADTFQAYAEHLGKYGYDPSQVPVGFFASGDQRHSRRIWIEATIKGNNPDTGDPAPTIAGTVLWGAIPVWNGSSFGGSAWSDNPPTHVRYLMTDPRILGLGDVWIDDEVTGETAEYCDRPIIDQTGGEDVYISTSSGTPGVDFKRYRSTGILDTWYFRHKLGLTAAESAAREVDYHTFNPASPPAPTPGTYYRKLWTSNWHLREKTKAVDFITKTLLPTFGGYVVWSAQGKLQIKCERPVLSSPLLAEATAGTIYLQVQDVVAWKKLNLPVLYVLVGADLATSETREVTAITYSTAGNSIGISAGVTGGVTATASGVNFSGGTGETQASATVIIGGTPASGNTVTVTIDSVDIEYTANANDTTGTIAALLAVRVNADPTLQQYVEALWSETNPTVLILRSKLGTLTVASALTNTHALGEVAAHMHMVFSDVAAGALAGSNIVKDSFSHPLGSRQSIYNQFIVEFPDAVQDSQLIKLIENDEVHQRKINSKEALEISGACTDSYHQANRQVLAARYKYRQGDSFTSLSTKGLALLCEEGDIYCVSHGSMPGKRNLMMRIEELTISPKHVVSIVGRLYVDAQFSTTAEERTIPLTTGIGWVSTPPEAVTNLLLSIPLPGTISGTFDFAPYIGSQTARILIKKPGDTDYTDTGLRVTPDINNDGAFQVAGIPDGVTYIKVIPYSTAGDGPETIGLIDTTATSINVLEYQVTDRPEAQMELEVQIFS